MKQTLSDLSGTAGDAPAVVPAPSARVDSEWLMRQLLETQRAAALGELCATTAHEFNNILMTVMNYARLGLRNPDPAARDKAFQRILEASERAAGITSSILGMARGRGDQFQPCDLVALVRSVLVLLEREMQKYRVQVETDLSPVPEIPAVASQIQQVLLNLMINARQAMPDGGRMVIRVRHDPAAGMVDLTVRDTGSGIPADRLPRIFEPGYSTKAGPDATGRGGSGIGLTACRAIVESHRGKIRVESSPGKGTAFTIRLPLVRPDMTPE